MKNAVIVVVIIVAVFGVAVVAGLAFRDDATEEAPVVTTPSEEQLREIYEEDLQTLKDAVAKFGNVDTYASANSIQRAFSDIEANYNAAVASGKKVKDAKISELEKAYNDLKVAIDDISSDQSLQQKIQAVKSALDTFVEKLEQI